MNDFKMTINGEAADSAETFKVLNPATEEAICEAPDASREQLDLAVGAARSAFKKWSATPLVERQAIVKAIGDRMHEQAEEFAQLLTAEQGKPLTDARRETARCIHWFREIAKQGPVVETVCDTPERLVEIRYLPIGVVGAITPWNFPLTLAAFKIAPALVTGNTVILKPSPFTPLTALKLGELVRDFVPPGVFNVLSGGDRLGPWITGHVGIDKIAFTGSTVTGRGVMRSAAVNLKRLTLELGGNDPAIVLGDSNAEALAPKLFWAAFSNNAQYCLASKRVYVHESIYDRFAQSLVDYAKTVKIGRGSEEGVQLGPVQNKPQYDRLCALLRESKAVGVKFLLGGDVPPGKGYFVPIAIADNPDESSRIVSEEAFGPILPLLKFSDVEDVVRRANNTIYGLGASVWGTDIDAAQKLADRLEAGIVWINTIHELSPAYPFGGHKQSGLGVENGWAGLLQYTNPQSIIRNKKPI